MIIAEVYCGIPTVAAFLCFVHDCFRGMLITISCRPAVHGVFGTAAEFQQLIPVMLHKIQDSGDHLVLFFLIVGKSIAVYMKMQAASACLMRTVALANGMVHDVFPRELVNVIVHGAGVRNQFHAIVQRAVCLDVKQVSVSV